LESAPHKNVHAIYDNRTGHDDNPSAKEMAAESEINKKMELPAWAKIFQSENKSKGGHDTSAKAIEFFEKQLEQWRELFIKERQKAAKHEMSWGVTEDEKPAVCMVNKDEQGKILSVFLLNPETRKIVDFYDTEALSKLSPERRAWIEQLVHLPISGWNKSN